MRGITGVGLIALVGVVLAFGWMRFEQESAAEPAAAPTPGAATAPAPEPAAAPGDQTRQQRAAQLLSIPQWSDSERSSYGRLIVNFEDTRAVLLRATLSPVECQRQATALRESRAVIQRNSGGVFEEHWTASVLAAVRADAQRMACPAVTAQVDGLIADRQAWAARQTPAGAGASPGEQCAHLSGYQHSRCLVDQVNRRVNGTPSAARSACFRAVEDDMRRTNNRLPNFRQRVEACQRIQ